MEDFTLKTIIRSFAVLAAIGSIVPFALAGPKPKATAPKCPKCHMTLVTKKDKVHPLAVKIKGKTYYCCATCGAHTAKHPAHKKASSTTKAPAKVIHKGHKK